MKKRILLIIIILFISVWTTYVLWKMCGAGIDYSVFLIQGEQKDHYSKMHEKVLRVNEMISELQALHTLIGVNKDVSAYKKHAMLERLRTMEEIAAEIDRETIYYNEDNSVHMFFPPEGRIVMYFDEARNTSLYMKRYVRSVEYAVFSGRITKTQAETIAQNFSLLQEELYRLSTIAQH